MVGPLGVRGAKVKDLGSRDKKDEHINLISCILVASHCQAPLAPETFHPWFLWPLLLGNFWPPSTVSDSPKEKIKRNWDWPLGALSVQTLQQPKVWVGFSGGTKIWQQQTLYASNIFFKKIGFKQETWSSWDLAFKARFNFGVLFFLGVRVFLVGVLASFGLRRRGFFLGVAFPCPSSSDSSCSISLSSLSKSSSLSWPSTSSPSSFLPTSPSSDNLAFFPRPLPLPLPRPLPDPFCAGASAGAGPVAGSKEAAALRNCFWAWTVREAVVTRLVGICVLFASAFAYIFMSLELADVNLGYVLHAQG